MRATLFNRGWTYREGIANPFDAINPMISSEDGYRAVVLPHDAMICEERSEACASANQSGYYPSKSYTYKKVFFVPEEWSEQETILEFEGVMKKSAVYLNGEFIAAHHFGYSQFYANLTPFLKYGKDNELKVVAINDEKSSRWYSGSGIYRDVHLWQGGQVYLPPEGVRISTDFVEEGYAMLTVCATVKNVTRFQKSVVLSFKINDKEGNLVAIGENLVTVSAGETEITTAHISLADPNLWSDETPYLYTITVEVEENGKLIDSAVVAFGVRTLKLDAKKGLRINGRETKLRGACIHHDNGILGATTLYDAERFRLEKLKSAGFNAIRSAHHPMSKSMLRACDELGMIVMDELTDMWCEAKNVNDSHIDFSAEWREEVERVVAKDFNHPSVVLYSLGNEVPEIGRAQGKRMNRALANAFRKSDGTRYVLNSINGFLAVSDYLGAFAAQGTDYAAQYAGQDLQNAGDGSEAVNQIMGGAEQAMLDAFSVNPLLTSILEEVSCELDVVGFNYLTARHELEHTLRPDRVVVGSETYPPEIARLWQIVTDNHHVIGDFTWTGYDYLGEAGIGVYHYNATRTEQGWYPDRLAYCGDINLNGYRRPVSYLREISYGLRKEPFMAVLRPEYSGQKCDMNNWKYYDALDSWTYPKYEGKSLSILVLSPSESVELFLNSKSIGKKKVGEKEAFTVFYSVPYESGELVAVGYTKGKEDGRFVLKTAGKAEDIKISVSKEKLVADGESVSFITVDLIDKNGVENRFEKRKITVTAEGAGALAGVGSANPSNKESYTCGTTETFDGRVMAAVRSSFEQGQITVTVQAEGFKPKKLKISVVSPLNHSL